MDVTPKVRLNNAKSFTVCEEYRLFHPRITLVLLLPTELNPTDVWFQRNDEQAGNSVNDWTNHYNVTHREGQLQHDSSKQARIAQTKGNVFLTRC